jgi:hypothetical protein
MLNKGEVALGIATMASPVQLRPGNWKPVEIVLSRDCSISMCYQCVAVVQCAQFVAVGPVYNAFRVSNRQRATATYTYCADVVCVMCFTEAHLSGDCLLRAAESA